MWSGRHLEREKRYLDGMFEGKKPRINIEHMGFYRIYSGLRRNNEIQCNVRKILKDEFFGRFNDAVSWAILQPEFYAHTLDISLNYNDDPAHEHNGYIELVGSNGRVNGTFGVD